METPADPCVRCDYDLRGVGDDQPCPECGLLAERSRQRSADLTDATPGWLRSIQIGVIVLLLAHALAVLWVPIYYFLVRWTLPRVVDMNRARPVWRLPWPFFFYHSEMIFLSAFDVAAVLLFAGVWIVSRPQPGTGMQNLDRRTRFFLRLSAAAPLVAMTLAHSLLLAQGYLGEFVMHWRQASILMLLTFGSAPMPVLLFILLRRLAQRVLHPRLAEHATIVAVGYAGTLILIPIVLWIEHLGEVSGQNRWDRGSVFVMLLSLGVMVAVALFGGWTALNCARFAIAFQKAHRGAQRKWNAADLATLTDASVSSPDLAQNV